MRICLLTTQPLDADPFPDDDWPCDPRPFLPEADWMLEVLDGKQASAERVAELVRDETIDVFFNLCDGAADQDLPGIEVIEVMERAGVAFTGAVSACYEPTRDAMKDACRRIGIATPASVTARTEDDVERAAETLRFPLFVKHPSSYASVDLSRRSRVCSPAGLRIQARKMMRRHGGALIEEFIEGIECTVLVAESPGDPAHPTAYAPMAYRFPAGETFKHEDLKWVEYDAMACAPVDDLVLAARLQDESARFFVALGAASFARCDIRVARDGTPYMLEINPNCGVFYPPTDPGSADLCLLADPGGHAAFARRLVDAALARRRAGDLGGGSSVNGSGVDVSGDSGSGTDSNSGVESSSGDSSDGGALALGPRS